CALLLQTRQRRCGSRIALRLVGSFVRGIGAGLSRLLLAAVREISAGLRAVACRLAPRLPALSAGLLRSRAVLLSAAGLLLSGRAGFAVLPVLGGRRAGGSLLLPQGTRDQIAVVPGILVRRRLFQRGIICRECRLELAGYGERVAAVVFGLCVGEGLEQLRRSAVAACLQLRVSAPARIVEARSEE